MNRAWLGLSAILACAPPPPPQNAPVVARASAPVSPCDLFATAVAQTGDSPEQRADLMKIAKTRCAAWPVDEQHCVDRTPDDAAKAEDACLTDSERKEVRDELADVSLDCSLVDPLSQQDAPAWAAAPNEKSEHVWMVAEMTFGWIAQNECRARGWPYAALRCLQRHDRAPRECLGGAAASFDAALAPALDLWKRAVAAKRAPTCVQLAEQTYNVMSWQAHHQRGTPKAARDALVKACEDAEDEFEPALRACIGLASSDRERHFCGIDLGWGFPPVALDPDPGDICAEVLNAEARGLLCQAAPPDAWDRAVDSLRKLGAAMAAPNPPKCTNAEVVARYAKMGCKL